MSGIYIPGLEMPKRGHTVTLTIMGGGEAVVQYYDCKPQLTVPIVYKAVPVPDHGDLIDRDKLEKDIDKYIGGEESRSRFHHWVQVQDAVIPMDKGEEK